MIHDVKTIVTFVVLICFILFDTASAQVLEEITVTAQKREQDLSDVGISITALSGSQLKQLGLTNTTQLGAQVPGLMITDYGSGTTTQYTIRGSSQLDFADHHEPPVAVYIDSAYNSYVAGVGFHFFDVERVEVLRGPQGTLFGRNATGGLVHLISAAPTREPEGYVEVSAGEYEQIRTEAALSGPLGETLAGRLSFAYEDTDGYQENRLGDDLNDVNNISLRGQLLFEPNDDLTIHINGNWSKDDTNGQGYSIRSGLTDIGGIPGLPGDGLVSEGSSAQQDAFCANFFGPPFPLVPGATDCFGHTEADNDDNSVAVDEEGFYKREHYGITGKIEWELGNDMRLVSITNWQDFDKRYLEDTDSTPASLFTFPQSIDSNQISQELQLHGETGHLQWVSGFYYLNIDGDFRSGANVINCCLADLDNSFSLETESYAFFLQGEYEFTPQLSFITGFRWTEDKKDLTALTRCRDAGSGEPFGLPAPPCNVFFGGTVQVGERASATETQNPLDVNRSEGEWSAVFELDWRPNEDLLLYAKYTRGNKAGGFNAGAAMLFTPEAFEFRGEILKSLEGGFKMTLLDGRARLNGSVFYYDYENFQSFSQQGINLIVFNTDAENVGAEIELIANPVQGLEFLFGLSLQDAKQKDVTFGPVTRDRAMPNAPDITFNGLGRYEWPMMNGTMSAQIDFNYVDERSLNGIDHPGLQGDSYLVANAMLGFKTGNWDASLWVKNFTDKDYVPTLFDITTFTGVIIDVPAAPRWFGGTLRYAW